MGIAIFGFTVIIQVWTQLKTTLQCISLSEPMMIFGFMMTRWEQMHHIVMVRSPSGAPIGCVWLIGSLSLREIISISYAHSYMDWLVAIKLYRVRLADIDPVKPEVYLMIPIQRNFVSVTGVFREMYGVWVCIEMTLCPSACLVVTKRVVRVVFMWTPLHDLW